MKKIIVTLALLIFPVTANAQQSYTKDEHGQEFRNLFMEMIELERNGLIHKGFGANNTQARAWLDKAKKFSEATVTDAKQPFASCHWIPNFDGDIFVCPLELIQLGQSFWKSDWQYIDAMGPKFWTFYVCGYADDHCNGILETPK